jgi:hypothetical protein
VNLTSDLIKVAVGASGIIAWWAWLVIGYIQQQKREAVEASRRCRNERDYREIVKEVKQGEHERQQGKVLEEDERRPLQ